MAHPATSVTVFRSRRSSSLRPDSAVASTQALDAEALRAAIQQALPETHLLEADNIKLPRDGQSGSLFAFSLRRGHSDALSSWR